ncbi:hypothetical protein FA15DRAFT_754536 [Coprinopsis marcescibilis]|uniref:Uncharacterized protein n=1 Tax=Coprinopsis marcescibilis TaxID=230819 RepID=A0A5C3L2R1_COPMA|nr:hypothetical protein FA15DRAFT_754536 [Coprinopsis marcescibilis]
MSTWQERDEQMISARNYLCARHAPDDEPVNAARYFPYKPPSYVQPHTIWVSPHESDFSTDLKSHMERMNQKYNLAFTRKQQLLPQASPPTPPGLSGNLSLKWRMDKVVSTVQIWSHPGMLDYLVTWAARHLVECACNADYGNEEQQPNYSRLEYFVARDLRKYCASHSLRVAIIFLAFYFIDQIFSAHPLDVLPYRSPQDGAKVLLRVFAVFYVLADKHASEFDQQSFETMISTGFYTTNRSEAFALERAALAVLDFNSHVSPTQWAGWLDWLGRWFEAHPRPEKYLSAAHHAVHDLASGFPAGFNYFDRKLNTGAIPALVIALGTGHVVEEMTWLKCTWALSDAPLLAPKERERLIARSFGWPLKA